jgi:hypothetical protein
MSNAKPKAPPCFPNDASLLAWRNMNHAVNTAGLPTPSGYCEDCTPDYQARMCAEGRCKYPQTSFIPVSKHGVEGRRAA